MAGTVACLLETLPQECFNHVVAHIPLSDMPKLSCASKAMAELCGSDNSELWNGLLCERLWTVDPSVVLSSSDTTTTTLEMVNWKDQYKSLVKAEQDHQAYLDGLRRLNLHGWLERHFIGQLAPHWNGWEARYWTWDSSSNSFAAWESERRRNCFARFPVDRQSQVRRVSEEEQIALTGTGASKGSALNPVTNPKPFVFTLSNTTFPMLWACRDEAQLQTWLDKISVTLHPLKFEGRTYKAPAKFRLEKKPCQP
ncbi:expressed unknown protein [Seminavis robusta]|uniref:F-box domain-containing protein n=1 Tax=Seminavis robusta TaxID=568900 RepID=A0A9N8DLD4_9STRA|nr:expressed unknown protein [Seminavis robusta]|eukprot:Sro195_g083210.1 n/a (254) ;mRNA; f:59843-60604